jgi:hypothetical protein
MCRDANHIDSGIVGMLKEHGSSPTKNSTICFMGPTQDDKLSQCNGSKTFLLPRNQSKVPQSGGIMVVA